MEKGSISGWNEGKGYGFIRPDGGGPDIFVHISAFSGADRRRRPQEGDRVVFDAVVQGPEKLKARTARYLEGVPRSAPLPARRRNPQASADRPPSGYRVIRRKVGVFVLVVLVPVAIVVGLVKGRNPLDVPTNRSLSFPDAPGASRSPASLPANSGFKCEGKRRCGQMSSKEEAQFYLENCPHDEMDGDHDGRACEQQFWK